jgi:hypothetical protein
MVFIPPFKITLMVLNFCILSFLVMLIVDHYQANYSLFSWSACFHFLSLSWLTIKGIFWLLTITTDYEWSAFQFYLLYWLPSPVEFGSYMLVPLFFGQVLYPDVWAAHNKWILPLYGLLVLSLVMFMVVWAVLAATEQGQKPCDITTALHQNIELDDYDLQHCFKMVYSSDAFRIVSACCFVLLAIFQVIFGWKLASLTPEEAPYYVQYFLMEPKHVSVVCYILFVCYLTEGTYEILATLDIITNPRVDLSGRYDVDPLVFCCFVCWDYLPTVLLVTTLTNRRLGSGQGSKSKSGSRKQRLVGDGSPPDGLGEMGVGMGGLPGELSPLLQSHGPAQSPIDDESGRTMDLSVRLGLVASAGRSVRGSRSSSHRARAAASGQGMGMKERGLELRGSAEAGAAAALGGRAQGMKNDGGGERFGGADRSKSDNIGSATSSISSSMGSTIASGEPDTNEGLERRGGRPGGGAVGAFMGGSGRVGDAATKEGTQPLAVPRSIFDDPNRYSTLSSPPESFMTGYGATASARGGATLNSTLGQGQSQSGLMSASSLERGAAHIARRKRGESMSEEDGGAGAGAGSTRRSGPQVDALGMTGSRRSFGHPLVTTGSIDPFPRNPGDVTSLLDPKERRLSGRVATPDSVGGSGSGGSSSGDGGLMRGMPGTSGVQNPVNGLYDD